MFDIQMEDNFPRASYPERSKRTKKFYTKQPQFIGQWEYNWITKSPNYIPA